MARKDESVLNLLGRLPWWVSVIVAGTAYFLLKYLIPAIPIETPIIKAFSGAASAVAPLVCLVLLIPAIISAINSFRRRHLLEKQKDIESLRSLSWREFESCRFNVVAVCFACRRSAS